MASFSNKLTGAALAMLIQGVREKKDLKIQLRAVCFFLWAHNNLDSGIEYHWEICIGMTVTGSLELCEWKKGEQCSKIGCVLTYIIKDENRKTCWSRQDTHWLTVTSSWWQFGKKEVGISEADSFTTFFFFLLLSFHLFAILFVFLLERVQKSGLFCTHFRCHSAYAKQET